MLNIDEPACLYPIQVARHDRTCLRLCLERKVEDDVKAHKCEQDLQKEEKGHLKKPKPLFVSVSPSKDYVTESDDHSRGTTRGIR